MSKHKKTLKEKKLADLHRQFLPINNKAGEINSYQFASDITIPKQTVSIIYTHQYLKHDLLKTVFLTSSLAIIQLIMLFMLKAHILKLPMINF